MLNGVASSCGDLLSISTWSLFGSPSQIPFLTSCDSSPHEGFLWGRRCQIPNNGLMTASASSERDDHYHDRKPFICSQIRRHKSWMAMGSKPANGSSNIITEGFWIKHGRSDRQRSPPSQCPWHDGDLKATLCNDSSWLDLSFEKCHVVPRVRSLADRLLRIPKVHWTRRHSPSFHLMLSSNHCTYPVSSDQQSWKISRLTDPIVPWRLKSHYIHTIEIIHRKHRPKAFVDFWPTKETLIFRHFNSTLTFASRDRRQADEKRISRIPLWAFRRGLWTGLMSTSN